MLDEWLLLKTQNQKYVIPVTIAYKSIQSNNYAIQNHNQIRHYTGELFKKS